MWPARGPRPETLKLFKSELWKDQRHLERIPRDGNYYLRKTYVDSEEKARELKVLRHLANCLHKAKVPEIVEEEESSATFPYIHGIRVFNLLVELDRLDPEVGALAQAAKRTILDRCEVNQREIQKGLLSLQADGARRPYPAREKILGLVQVLGDCLGLVVEQDVISAELDALEEEWRDSCFVPFRDAAVKNMVLADSSLWLGEFDSEEARREHIRGTFAGSAPKWLDAPIVDFDFCSCIHDTTPEDDPISLRYHERTWSGRPRHAGELTWHVAPNSRRAALTFLVRYFRFGGRKAAYRLLHPSGHRIRFRHDNDRFYFERLPSILTQLSTDLCRDYQSIVAFSRAVGRALHGARADIDHFLAAKLAERRTYYVDMYPE